MFGYCDSKHEMSTIVYFTQIQVENKLYPCRTPDYLLPLRPGALIYGPHPCGGRADVSLCPSKLNAWLTSIEIIECIKEMGRS